MTNRKPFSLEKWRKLGDNCKVFTKSGVKIKDLYTFSYPSGVPGLVATYDHNLLTWCALGQLLTHPYASHVKDNLDLELEYESTTITKWINIYPNNSCTIHDTESIAKGVSMISNQRIACVPVEIEYCEGDGL